MMEFIMQIVNPAMYKEYANIKNSTVHESATYEENMTEERFREITAIADRRMQQASAPQMQPTVAEQPQKEEKAEEFAPIVGAHPRFNLQDPSTWVRPAHLPPMRQVQGETDINPVSFE
jgi:hypothetical protein